MSETEKIGKAVILNNNQNFTYHNPTTTNPITPLQTFLEISTSAFNYNVNYYKNIIGYHNKLAAVIKGNGYGHGLHQMAYVCQQNEHIDWLLVMQLSEALALQNISKPILILGYSDVPIENAIGKNIQFMIDNLAYAQKLNTVGKQHSYQFDVHIKVDTGLSRMGILAPDAIIFIHQIQQLDYINIVGICSHFSASDSQPEFTAQQYTQFNNVITDLFSKNITVPYIHMSNTAAISNIQYKNYFNFFRMGIGLYGLGHERSHLQPIMTWKTHITHIKTIPANSYVSYAGEYQTKRTTRIALLPIGYYDGYKFRFSNKTSVLINGTLAPVIGRVAMNITIVDVTDITADTDDEVVLMGPYQKIGAHDLAELGNIKNVREILVGINPAFTRIITE
ncbi:MAG TPA: alanine racemase [Candidatus Babeliales bacterium]|jgi:alanine racemase|nr:alanine racemase [Candidatus Babeliales bacterium]